MAGAFLVDMLGKDATRQAAIALVNQVHPAIIVPSITRLQVLMDATVQQRATELITRSVSYILQVHPTI